ncbi:MAG TPA: hemerythrin domain-containing protein [Candidatus Moranbacteria bacterium]|nr:hemerythrin domain-containing protein [Candidatus Moranbacteria bacterium]HRY28091.1 hemerythrin domain-containing protein [Candidatus Moranbacteria bacterium]HSA08256.1 hemerythrin domain-containing protein [Candidatus Moranbacteria bacterium]
MNPIEELTKEHGPVKLMLRILEKASDQLEAGQEMNVSDLENAVAFIREFADKCHHGKEERLLFPAMEENNIAEEMAIIDALIEEHKIGRNFVKNMSEAIAEKDSSKFIKNARGYIALLNPHIDKENQKLFPMAGKSLSEEKQKELELGFEDIEKNVIGEGRHEELHAIIHKLKDKYL